METVFEIQQTKKTPSIIFNFDKGLLEIKGYSLPINALDFYTELYQYTHSYIKNPKEETILHFNFEYINTSSLKVIVNLLNQFETLVDMGKQVELNWYVSKEDSDMKDIGKLLINNLNYPINIIELD